MGNKNIENPTNIKYIPGRFISLLKKIWSIRFFRFLFVGGINTLFGYVVFSVFILLNFHYAIALLLATILGILFNFFTTGKIVFKNNDLRLIFKFVGVYGITYIINLFFLKTFNSYQINMLIAGAILILPMAILSFFLNKTFVFKGNNSKSNK